MIFILLEILVNIICAFFDNFLVGRSSLAHAGVKVYGSIKSVQGIYNWLINAIYNLNRVMEAKSLE